jgi:hypothetical protein
MPVHDWTRVYAGLFHHFHQRWIQALCDRLNTGALPPGYYALSEQVAGGPIPDVLTLQQQPEPIGDSGSSNGTALAVALPRARYILRAEADPYVAKASRIAIRHPSGQVVSVIEIVSPGNQGSRATFRAFVEKAVDLLRQGIHLLVVDLFPPTSRDPQGIHKAIWDEIQDVPFELPPDKPLTLVSYSAGLEKVAFIEPIAVGDDLPDMPLFLEPEKYVPAPLETTYQAAWAVYPAPLKDGLTSPRSNGESAS